MPKDHKTGHIWISGKERLSDALRTALAALSGTTGKTIRYTRPLRCGEIARCHDTNIGLFCAPRTVLVDVKIIICMKLINYKMH